MCTELAVVLRGTSGYGTFETSTDVSYMTAFGGKADITQRLRTIAIYEYTP